MNVTLSVILISYNTNDYVLRALNSVIKQRTNYKFEIIIIDDGSDDESIKTIKNFKLEHPETKLFIMDRPKNLDLNSFIPSMRVSDAIKKGIRESSGDYFCILSADDYFVDLDKFDNQINFLENNKKYIATYSDYVFARNNGEMHNNLIPPLSRIAFWGTTYCHISCFIFRRECTRYLKELFCDDTGMTYSIIRGGQIKHISRITFAYCENLNSITNSYNNFETELVGTLQLQDILNCGYIPGSLGKFFDYLKTLKCKRNSINWNNQYKYIEQCLKYNFQILNDLKEYDNKFINKFRFNIIYYCSLIERKIINLYVAILKRLNINKSI